MTWSKPARTVWTWLWSLLPDKCEICHGARGGVRGNENRVAGLTLCDYCSVEVARGLRPAEFGRDDLG